MNRVAFIDRDGTMICEPEDYQVDRLEKVKFTKGSISALKALKQKGYKLVMVTNQDGLGTESFPKKDFKICQEFILDVLASEDIYFDEILICPHTPEDQCLCRKPHLGLVQKYLKNNMMDYDHSFVVGDRDSDKLLAKNLGVEFYPYFDAKNLSKKADGLEGIDWPTIVQKVTANSSSASVVRKTNETNIECAVELYGTGESEIKTGLGFFDHMLEQLSKHSGVNLKLQCDGDLYIDDHHSVEDVAICLGQTLKKALGPKVGVERYGSFLPMDEAKAEVLIDLSGRFHFEFEGEFKSNSVGELNTQMVPHFFRSLAENMGMTLHMKVSGENDHHQVEILFKAFAKALKQAITRSGSGVPSTKGVL